MLLLAVGGGAVDAIVILAFGVLTAAQTGNTVLLAVAAAQHRLVTVVTSATSVAGYLLGAALGEFVILRGGAGSASAVGRALVAEVLPMSCLLVLWLVAGAHPGPATSALLVALAALAMGMQSAAVQRLQAGPTTTYVTGTITTFVIEMIRWVRRLGSEQAASHGHPGDDPASSLDAAWLFGATWAVYALAAAVSALLYLSFGATALILPLAAIGAAGAMQGRRRS